VETGKARAGLCEPPSGLQFLLTLPRNCVALLGHRAWMVLSLLRRHMEYPKQGVIPKLGGVADVQSAASKSAGRGTRR
jgi:hypothetical protein